MQKLQSNGVAFANPDNDADRPSWLYWDGGTKAWVFSGDTVTIPNRAHPGEYMRYRCELAA